MSMEKIVELPFRSSRHSVIILKIISLYFTPF